MTHCWRIRPPRPACRFTVAVVTTGLLSSCATFVPDARTPEQLVSLPDSFTLYGPVAPAPDRWWKSFENAELSALVEESLRGNFSLQQAYARLRQAGALARQARAARFPTLGYSADASVSRTYTDVATASVSPADTATNTLNALGALASGGSGGVISATSLQSAQSRLQALDTLFGSPDSVDETTTTESYAVGLSASYEVDLWGRVRAGYEASRLSLEASRQDLYDAMQSIAAQVTYTWLDLLYDRQVLAVVHQQLETNQDNLELLELRYRNGQSSALDIYQQRQAVAQSAAAIPSLEAGIQTLQHQLAVLLGKAPTIDLGLTADRYPELGLLPEQGLPADLLAKRSDVRAAGLRLASADWDVSAARADRLPALSLTGTTDFNGASVSTLFDNWLARLAGSVTGPIFDAGRRKAEVERTRAVVDEYLAAYRGTVITAMLEVEDALVHEARQRDYIEALTAQYEAAKASLEEARVRYRKGLNDYLPVLSALTNQQSLEQSLVAARHDLLYYRVQLHLALGGDWTAEEAAYTEEVSQ